MPILVKIDIIYKRNNQFNNNIHMVLAIMYYATITKLLVIGCMMADGWLYGCSMMRLPTASALVTSLVPVAINDTYSFNNFYAEVDRIDGARTSAVVLRTTSPMSLEINLVASE